MIIQLTIRFHLMILLNLVIVKRNKMLIKSRPSDICEMCNDETTVERRKINVFFRDVCVLA